MKRDSIVIRTAAIVTYTAVFACFAVALIIAAVQKIRGAAQPGVSYTLMIFQAALGLLAAHLPLFLKRGFGWNIPDLLSCFYYLFVFGSLFLGEILSFYYLIGFFDDILHFMSAVLLGIFGLSIFRAAEKESKGELSPLFAALSTVAFAVFVGVLWEIFEFAADGVLGINMQKFLAPSDGVLYPLVGRAALTDTMQDLIIDSLGALSVGAAAFIIKRRKSPLLDSLTVVFKNRKN